MNVNPADSAPTTEGPLLVKLSETPVGDLFAAVREQRRISVRGWSDGLPRFEHEGVPVEVRLDHGWDDRPTGFAHVTFAAEAA